MSNLKLWTWVKLKGQYIALGMINRYLDENTVEVVEPKTGRVHIVKPYALRKASKDEIERLQQKIAKNGDSDPKLA